MLDQNLVSYIQESLKLGNTKEQIQKALVDNGWKTDAVDEGFRSLENNIPTPNLTQTLVSSVSSVSKSQPIFGAFLEKNFTLIGLGEILVSGLIFFIYFNAIINHNIAIYVSVFEVFVGFIGSVILFILTKAFKVSNNNFSKALFFSGSLGLTAAILQLFNLLHFPSFITSLLYLCLLVGSFILLAKLYVLTVGRSIALGISNIIVTAIIGVILAFVFTLFGLFKIQSLFQSSNYQNSVESEQLDSEGLSNINYSEDQLTTPSTQTEINTDNLATCSNDFTCEEGYVCYHSQSWPKGGEAGPEKGDLLCHQSCEVDNDCTTGSCETKEISKGDIGYSIKFCNNRDTIPKIKSTGELCPKFIDCMPIVPEGSLCGSNFPEECRDYTQIAY